MLQTQFWDTSPSTGPTNSWTVHGLWPDHCDGTFDSSCDSTRAYTNITAILKSFGKTDLLAYMNTYWVDLDGDNESFWSHEWSKHGTCISTLNTKCYTSYTPQQEVADFFQKTIDLFKGLDSYTVSVLPMTLARIAEIILNVSLDSNTFMISSYCNFEHNLTSNRHSPTQASSPQAPKPTLPQQSKPHSRLRSDTM